MNEASLLTAAQAGELLGISARSVYSLAQAGRIACHRLGVGNGAIRFAVADVQEYKASCRSPATTQAVGTTSLIASYPAQEGSALTAYFRRAGHALKPSHTNNGKRRGYSRLQLVSSASST
jgi:excisionase family DNA binding protein